MSNSFPTTSEQIEKRVLSNIGVTREEFDRWNTAEYSVDKDTVDMMKALIEHADKIRVFGDYDCDGTCASAIAYKGIKAVFNKEAVVTLPRRFTDGYGINPKAVDRMYEEDRDLLSSGKNILLITVDNGIAAYDALTKAKEYGYKVLVTDHHEKGLKIPDADLCIDPKVDGYNPFESPYYCGAGVIYKLLCQMTDNTELKDELKQLTALATVADVMPLFEDNHKIVRETLSEMNEGHIIEPLQMLCDTKAISPQFITEKTFGFEFGPCINAMSRLHDDGAMFAYNFLLHPTKEDAEIIVENNELRKEITKNETAVILSEVTEDMIKADRPLILYHPDLHEGMIGIIAGKITESTGLPSIVLTDDPENKEIVKGSARSIEGFNIVKYLQDINIVNPDLFAGFGGHQGAAGLSVRREYLKDFISIANHIEISMPSADERPDAPTPIYIRYDGIDRAYDAIRQFAPYGEGNPDVNVTMVFNKYKDFPKLIGKDKDKIMINRKPVRKGASAIKVMVFDQDKIPDYSSLWVEGYLEKSDFAGEGTIMLKGSGLTPEMRKCKDNINMKAHDKEELQTEDDIYQKDDSIVDIEERNYNDD